MYLLVSTKYCVLLLVVSLPVSNVKVGVCQVNLTTLCRKEEIYLLVLDWFVSVARKNSFRSDMVHGMFKDNRDFHSFLSLRIFSLKSGF